MIARAPTQYRSLVRPTAVVCVMAAALLNAYALGVGKSPNLIYVWASLIAAVPIALFVVFVAGQWPRVAALGTLGLVAFSAALAMEVSRASDPEPMLVAMAGVVVAGGMFVRIGRARWADVLGGLLLTYASAAFLFEVSFWL